MAKLTYFFPGGKYPADYTPPIEGFDYNPPFRDLVDLKTAAQVGTPSSTTITFQLDNGLKLKIIGTGFTFGSDGATGGTIARIDLLLNDGTTLVQRLESLNLSLVAFENAAEVYDPPVLEQWLMNRPDTFVGSAGDDDMFGWGGNDTFSGGAGDDLMAGGQGKDTYDGGTGTDYLNFRVTHDDPAATQGIVLDAAAGTVTDPYGNAETFTSVESFAGTQFADTMRGSGADEQFMGFGGRDYIDGRGGFDVIRFHRDADVGGKLGVTVNLATGVAIDGFGKTDTFVNIEAIYSTQFADKLTGNAGDNVFRAEAGNDFIDGGLGADTMEGGSGNDTYVVNEIGDVIDEVSHGGSGVDTVRSSISFSLVASDKVEGAVENLTLLGTASTNATGNSLANTLVGNSGNNILSGSSGKDKLTGGLGNDSFFFNSTLSATSNVDTITDFNVANDTIRLENAVFTAISGTGTLTAAQFVKNTTGLAADTTDRIIYESDTGKLFYDSNGSGSGGSVHFATVGTNLSITAADFFVV
ncbi:calcium-binding protein [Sinorhizobium americanum]|uniref:Alkaline phosphatase n=1 Tax=Sinorhizobium americanum TaxID=194963 RepID=A0A1L3LZ52_9HYPH|nr:calcium-binding protein [Sinorhizobium americanum]APG95372.1 alkaline phosphatase [Sinorhizobium americanum]OAP46486.1 calcium-binding protein [Sinorhizobium americanum]